MAMHPSNSSRPPLSSPNDFLMSESTKVKFFESRDWRTSKYPLRMIARAIFLTYMWGGVIQLSVSQAYKRSNEKMVANGLEYLTLLGFLGTTLTMIVSSIHEFTPGIKGLKIGLNGLFLVIETMITLLYWGLYFSHNDLILDRESKEAAGGVPPFFMDTAGHLVPFIAMLAEFLFTRSSKRHLYEQRFFHLLAIAFFTFGYFCWILYLFHENNKFPYPFLRLMSPAARVVYTVFSMFLGVFIYGVASRAYFKYHATEGDLPVYDEEYYEDVEEEEEDV